MHRISHKLLIRVWLHTHTHIHTVNEQGSLTLSIVTHSVLLQAKSKKEKCLFKL